MEVRPVREGAERGEREREIEKECEFGRGGVGGVRGDPVGEEKERRREDDEVVDGEMRGQENGREQ